MDILVVDDDEEVLGTVDRALQREGHNVITATSAAQARSLIREVLPDLLVLDIMMPETSGLELCAELRADPAYGTLPILFLTAMWRTDDIVRGLDAGGDDYLTKPFELKELKARVRALLRRSGPPAEPANTNEALSAGGLVLDPTTYQVTTRELGAVQLTSTEFRLLQHLVGAPGQAHSVRDLLDAVWEYPPGTGDADLVRAHIRNLRAKIEPDSSTPVYVVTIHGVGYMVRE